MLRNEKGPKGTVNNSEKGRVRVAGDRGGLKDGVFLFVLLREKMYVFSSGWKWFMKRSRWAEGDNWKSHERQESRDPGDTWEQGQSPIVKRGAWWVREREDSRIIEFPMDGFCLLRNKKQNHSPKGI